MATVLELRDIVKQYPTHTAVDGVSLAIEHGAFYSLLGPSGCGKTTTLRMIAGFEQPTTGEIWLGGELINTRPAYQRNVSTVFQSYALFPHLTVTENVAFGLRERGLKDTRQPVNEALAMVQLTGKETRLPAKLSGGERQRVALARSLVLKPDVLLLDEPLAALDPKLRKQMRAELKDMQRRAGITFLFVTHDQEEALSMSDRIAVMNAGKVEQVGTAREVYLQPKTKFVAGFLGAVNWVDGIGVRPECVTVAREGQGIEARVLRSVFLGNVAQVVVSTHLGELLAETPEANLSLKATPSKSAGTRPMKLSSSALLPARIWMALFFAASHGGSCLAYSFLTPRRLRWRRTTPGPSKATRASSTPSTASSSPAPSPWPPRPPQSVHSSASPSPSSSRAPDSGRAFTSSSSSSRSGRASSWFGTYAWLVLRRDTGLVNTILQKLGLIHAPLPLLYNDGAVLLGLVYGYLPFMVLPIFAILEKLDPASPRSRRRPRCASPQALSSASPRRWANAGIVAGSILVFVPCLGAYLTPDLMGGGKTVMIGNLVQNQFSTARDWPFGAAASFILMAITGVAITLSSYSPKNSASLTPSQAYEGIDHSTSCTSTGPSLLRVAIRE